jgi:reactive chlorine resistance protein C
LDNSTGRFGTSNANVTEISANAASRHMAIHPYVHHILRLMLATVFLAFGYVKFSPFEADGVEPLMSAHPALSWLLPTSGKAGPSAFLGVEEIGSGIALLIGFRSALANSVGGVLTLVTFAITVSLFFFIPGVFEESAAALQAKSTPAVKIKDSLLASS